MLSSRKIHLAVIAYTLTRDYIPLSRITYQPFGLDKKQDSPKTVLFFGAGGGTRTHTPSLTTDFESVSSASSNTPAYVHNYCNEIGATGRIRTGDLFITSELLYRLSHGSVAHFLLIISNF